MGVEVVLKSSLRKIQLFRKLRAGVPAQTVAGLLAWAGCFPALLRVRLLENWRGNEAMLAGWRPRELKKLPRLQPT